MVVPQVHFPVRLVPPRVAALPAPLGRAAALATLANGGALLLWSSGAPNVRPVSQLVLRAVSPDGTPGPIWELRRVPGTVRGIDLVMRGETGLMIWNAELGGTSSQISAERVRADGTLEGGPFGIGTYRVTDPTVPDAGGASADHLGFPARVVSTDTGFAVAVRGTLARCGAGLCPSVRVADVDLFSAIRGRGGLQNQDPTGPITLLGSQEVPWALAVTYGGGSTHAHIETLGQGPLAGFAMQDAALIAAWLHGGAARVLVKRGAVDLRGAPAFQVLGAGVSDAGAGFGVHGATFACDAGRPTVSLTGPAGRLTVRADEPGADSVFLWAMGLDASPRVPTVRTRRGAATPPPASQAATDDTISDVTWIRDGLLVARATRLELQRCEGATLAPPTVLPWEPPAVGP